MKIGGNIQAVCILLWGAIAFNAFALYDGETDSDAWTGITNDLEIVRKNLQDKMIEASDVGIRTDYASVSLTTLTRFQTWAQFDRDHPEAIYAAVTNEWWADDFEIFPFDYNIRLPFDEVQDCIDLGNSMIQELQDQVNGSLTMQAPPDLTAGTMTMGTDAWYRNGTPTIPSGFCWMPDEPDYLDAYGNIGAIFYPLSKLQSDGTIADSVWEKHVEVLNEENARGDAPQVFVLGSAISSWMKTEYPDIQEGRRSFIKWDIDHPMIRPWLTQYVEELFPHLMPASGSTPRMHMLANEPHFSLMEGGWAVEYGISEYTKDKYGDWLEEKYTTVSNLNAVHGSAYNSFVQAGDELPFDMSNSDARKWGVSNSLQGGPVWYDIMRFNMDRANDWFKFCADLTTANDPEGWGCNIKLLGRAFAGEGRDGGIDVEYLAKLQGVLGSDLYNASYNGISYRGHDDSWKSRYTMKWEDQAMSLDFYKSICPDKLFHDSEWHALDSEWKDIDMSPEFVRAAMWLASTHGYSSFYTWVWGRKNDGDFRSVNSMFIGEVLSQPKVLDAYGRSLKEMNAHAASIISMIPTNRQFLIYYCEESAIQDLEYVPDMTEVYKALKLLNIPMGFTTPTEIAKLTSNHTVIVPRTSFILDSSLVALSNFTGNVVIVDEANCFTKTEHGFARGESGLSPYGTVDLTDDFTMATDFDTLLDPLKTAPPLQVDVEDASGLPAYGVFVKQSEEAGSGDVTLCLMNMSSHSRTVSVHLPSGYNSCRDLITGESLWPVQTMESYDILLLKPDATIVNAPASPPPAQPKLPATIVRWGAPEGDMNICTGLVEGVGIPYNSSYQSGQISTPDAGTTSYYPNTNSVSHAVNFTTSHRWPKNNELIKNDDVYGDHLYHGVGGGPTNMEVMIVWENFLTPAKGIQSIATSLSRDNATDANCHFRFVVQNGNGKWYASQERNVESRSGFDSFRINTDDENWFGFTPITSSAASIGSESTPNFTDIMAVGVYIKRHVTSGWKQVGCRHFEAVGLVPVSAWDYFVDRHGLSGIPSNDADNDGHSDLYEFALDGDPTNDVVQGKNINLVYHSDNNVSFYNLESAYADPGIAYQVEWTTNLVSGLWSTNFNHEAYTGTTNQNYNEARRRVWGGDKPELFFRLKVSRP